MKDRKRLLASELPLDDTEDFVRMIYIRLYGQRKNMKYTIKKGKDIEINGYRFCDFEIERKD